MNIFSCLLGRKRLHSKKLLVNPDKQNAETFSIANYTEKVSELPASNEMQRLSVSSKASTSISVGQLETQRQNHNNGMITTT